MTTLIHSDFLVALDITQFFYVSAVNDKAQVDNRHSWVNTSIGTLLHFQISSNRSKRLPPGYCQHYDI